MSTVAAETTAPKAQARLSLGCPLSDASPTRHRSAQFHEDGISARARDRIAETLGGALVPFGRFGCIARAVAGS
jgi:hypothetical protein